MKKYIFTLFFLLAATNIIRAQIGINTLTPKASLDIKAHNDSIPTKIDGILITRVSNLPTNTSTITDGTLIYLTKVVGSNNIGFYYWDKTAGKWEYIVNRSVVNLKEHLFLIASAEVHVGDLGNSILKFVNNEGFNPYITKQSENNSDLYFGVKFSQHESSNYMVFLNLSTANSANDMVVTSLVLNQMTDGFTISLHDGLNNVNDISVEIFVYSFPID